MGMVTGSHHMQVFWLPGMKGNLQIGFPFAWLIDDQRWAPRNSLFIRDPHTVISKENWNMNCIRCHTTGPQPRPNQAAQRFESRVADLGISCEACHGPAKRHVDRQQRLARLPEAERQQALDAEPLAIVQPADLDHVRSSQVCGSCHGMKWFDESEEWTAHGFRYRPGDDLEQTTPIIRPTQLEQQPWLKPVLEKNPGIFNDFFWPDGHIRVTGREYNGLLESPCYQRGEMSCVSCHSMHKSDPDDQLARGMRGNQACLQCHDEMSDDLTRHTRHVADSPGSNCTNCHMPHTSYGLLKAIRGHTIETPDVATTLCPVTGDGGPHVSAGSVEDLPVFVEIVGGVRKGCDCSGYMLLNTVFDGRSGPGLVPVDPYVAVDVSDNLRRRRGVRTVSRFQ